MTEPEVVEYVRVWSATESYGGPDDQYFRMYATPEEAAAYAIERLRGGASSVDLRGYDTSRAAWDKRANGGDPSA